MNTFGVHYIRTVPFTQRKHHAETIETMQSYCAVVLTCSVWYNTEYKCCIVHKDQPIYDMLNNISDVPNTNIAVFDSITKKNVSLDLTVKQIEKKNDLTRYIHVVII